MKFYICYTTIHGKLNKTYDGKYFHDWEEAVEFCNNLNKVKNSNVFYMPVKEKQDV